MSTTTVVCDTQAPLGSCDFRLPPDKNDPITVLSNPDPTRRVMRATIGKGPDDHLSCVQNVIWDDGFNSGTTTVIGNCTPSETTTAIADCTTRGGLATLTGRTGNAIDSIVMRCQDGTIANMPAFGSGGDQFNIDGQCGPGHYLSSMSGALSNGDTDITDFGIVCSPLFQRCKGDIFLTDPSCGPYCNSFTGVCDTNIQDFCSQPVNFDKPICGCALPANQYPILSLATQIGASLPIACDARCQRPEAIHLANTGTCNIGTLCIQQGIDITAVQSSIGQGITLSQNCTSNNSNNGGASTTNNFFSNPTFLIGAGLGLLLIIIVIIIIVVVASRKKKPTTTASTTQRRSTVTRL